jgi:hypothetical protein
MTLEPGSSLVWWLGYGLDDWGSILGSDSHGIFSLRLLVQIGSGAHPTSYPISTKVLILEAKRPQIEADNVEVKNVCIYTSIPLYICMAWCLIKQRMRLHSLVLPKLRDNFTLRLLLYKHVYTWQWYSAGLWAGWSVVRVPVGTGNLSLHFRLQTGSGARPDSYPMGTRGSFPGG